jgi:hypothetical protein
MRFILTIAMLVAAAPSLAGAYDVPLPRPRPAEAPAAQIAPPEPSACQLRLKREGVEFAALPPLAGPGECGAPDVVRLESVATPGREHIALVPPPTLRCSMAEAVAAWVRTDIVALAEGLGASLKTIENYDSYDCRGQNRVVGARLSEHGKANALDIRSVKLANGKVIMLTDRAVSHAFRESLRLSACARFKTVLGPGSDGYHEEHIHVDLAERSHDYRICHWEVRDPPVAEIPVPRPRPVAATADHKL